MKTRRFHLKGYPASVCYLPGTKALLHVNTPENLPVLLPEYDFVRKEKGWDLILEQKDLPNVTEAIHSCLPSRLRPWEDYLIALAIIVVILLLQKMFFS